MSHNPKRISKKEQEQLNRKLAPVYRKIGALTFSVGLISLLTGLWIDRVNKTQPIFTLALVAVSVPIVLWINTRTLRKAIFRHLEEIKKENSSKS